ncbi:hypothetical protein [Desulfotignum balticum]|uniref:hypothetical protein n=1 Tax=Desulfotignum balticum TaxID=115781 RepID=UPI000429E4C4|nr:hypothetical protein [Desulfotignum balticum]
MGLLNRLFKNMPNKMERELRQEGLELRKKHNEDCLKKIQELYPNKNITELMKMAEQMTQEYEQMMGYQNPNNYNDYWEKAAALEHYEKTGDTTKYIYVQNKSITK